MKTRSAVILALLACMLAGRLGLAIDARGEGAAAAPASPAIPIADEKKTVAYRIARDRISIAVVNEPDLNVASKRVDVNGNVNLQLVGDVHIEGLTQVEAQTAIENAYRDGRFLRNPQVTINIEEYATRSVTVNGLVKYPGITPLPPETTTTLKDLINRVGLAETANAKGVKISRPQPDGTTKYFTKNVDGLLRAKENGNSADGNFIIEPGDTIYVPEKIF